MQEPTIQDNPITNTQYKIISCNTRQDNNMQEHGTQSETTHVNTTQDKPI